METSSVHEASTSVQHVRIAFETRGFTVNDGQILSIFKEKIKEELRSKEIFQGQKFQIKLFAILTVGIEVKNSYPEKGVISPQTRIDLFPIYRDRKEKETEMLFTKTILPDDRFEGIWNGLVGLDDEKQKVLELFQICLSPELVADWFQHHYPEAGEMPDFLTTDHKGKVLFAGVTGTGKTSLAYGVSDAFARKKNCRIVFVEVGLLRDELVSKSTERVIRLFDEIRKLATDAIVILFLDEFDTIAPSRMIKEQHDEVRASVNVLLQELEKISFLDNVLVIAATNLLENVDVGNDRRFDFILKFQKPDLDSRKMLLWKLLSPIDFGPSEISILARNTEGYSQADIKRIILADVRHSISTDQPLTLESLLRSLKKIEPSRG